MTPVSDVASARALLVALSRMARERLTVEPHAQRTYEPSPKAAREAEAAAGELLVAVAKALPRLAGGGRLNPSAVEMLTAVGTIAHAFAAQSEIDSNNCVEDT